ncbi:MAG TPA: BTAD domain-containing putative transcriptional regulator [Kribbella sp.]|nr:BTAD domain-containing putative transcriptional regulator [Kribbella sp.]
MTFGGGDPSGMAASAAPGGAHHGVPGSGVLSSTAPRFGILGGLEVTPDDHRLELSGPKQRLLLAMLLIHLNQFVSAGRLVEALWGSEPPASAEVTLRTHVSHLRRRLAAIGAPEALVTRRSGYSLTLDPEQVDAYRFERLVGLGQEALGLADAVRASQLLRDALDLWRGPVLADLDRPLFAEAETARLEELRLDALEARISADLALGRYDVISELERLVVDHPFRERFCGQLMLALYRAGRQVDALAVYSSARQRLADELGLDPGPALSALETAILRRDPTLLPTGGGSVSPAVQASTTRRPRVKPPPDALFTVVRRVPMVGRSSELDRLSGLWREVRGGGRRVVLVSGEAGVGKTRLVAEFAHQAAEDEAVFLVGRCDQASIPYQPVASAFRTSAEAEAVLADAPEAIRGRLGWLLDEPPAAADVDSSRSDVERAAQFEAVEWLLAQLVELAPVVLVMEESERIDRASSLLLRHLVNTLPERVFVVFCFRDPPGSRHPALLELLGELEGRGLADRLVLRPLSEGDIGSLVAGLTGGESATFVHELWRSTGGNPFYASEVVRDLETRGELGGRGALPVPSGVRDVLRHRLRVLSEATQQVVCCAAVLGREVEFSLLARLAAIPEDPLIDALDHALGAGFLVEAGSSWKVSYTFPHDLMREAVYADIPITRRQRLHLRAAEALQSSGARRGNGVAAAAVHLRAAGPAADPVQTAELSLQAADEAARLYAWHEAVDHAEAAVEILDHAGASPARRADAAVRTAMLRLKSSIGYRRAVQHLETALQLYRGVGDDAAAATVHSRLGGALCTHHSVMDIPRAIEHIAAAERLLGDRKAAFHLHRGMAQAAMYGVRSELLGDYSERATTLAGELGRRDLVVMASWGRAWFEFNCGRLSDASALREAMWATAHELADPYLGWVSVGAAALCATEYLLDPAAGRSWCRRGLAQARFDTFAHPHDTVVDQFVLALASTGDLDGARRLADPLPADAVCRRVLTSLDGEWEQAERGWAAALSDDEEAGDLHDAALSARWLGGVRMLLGDQGGAVAALRRAVTIGVEGPQVPTELAARAELARVLAGGGEVGEAALHLTRCDEIMAEGQDWRGQVGVVELARGAVAGAQGQPGECDDAHENAVAIFTAYQLPWRRAAAFHAWAESLSAMGRHEAAVGKHQASWQVYDEICAPQRWRRPLAQP